MTSKYTVSQMKCSYSKTVLLSSILSKVDQTKFIVNFKTLIVLVLTMLPIEDMLFGQHNSAVNFLNTFFVTFDMHINLFL